jgi:hypothetical protein
MKPYGEVIVAAEGLGLPGNYVGSLLPRPRYLEFMPDMVRPCRHELAVFIYDIAYRLGWT